MNNEFVIFTDTGSDMPLEKQKEWDIHYIDLLFHEKGHESMQQDLPLSDFYRNMRSGTVYQTSAANPDAILEAFTPYLAEGKDILYLAFSSGLSATYQSATIAATQLREQFPKRKLYILDSRCASAGLMMLVDLVRQERDKGAAIEALYEFAKNTAPRICHWFTVDDLVYLKRGGRVSAASAFVAGVLDIKPILHMDEEGHLINRSKVRGRRAALRGIMKKYAELASDSFAEPVYICHADCQEAVPTLEKALMTSYGISVTEVVNIGPVIGSHCGPGTVALFFLGKQR